MADLDAVLEDYPSALLLSRSVTGVWPEHQTYLARNFKVRSPEQMTPTELASSSILKLIGSADRLLPLARSGARYLEIGPGHGHPDAGLASIEAAGFEIVSQELYATQGRPIEKALRDRISISMAVVGRKN